MIGFIDDSTDKSNRTIDNYKIYNPDLIEKLVLKYNVEILFIAIPSASFSRRKLILKDLIDKELNVKIKILPGLDSLIDKNINFNLMEDISIEDIIGREIVPPVKHLIEKNILNKTILITGAAGTIGSELCRKILEIGPKKLIAIDSSEIGLFNLIKKCNDYDSEKFFLLGDLKDKRFIKKFLNDYPNIDTIYHVAAYKHVNIVESNKLSGFYNNVVIINNLISAIQDKGIKKFINVSTDKAVNPTSIMGLSKYFCELIVNEYSKKTDIEFSIVRFGNVLKSSGSVLTIFDEQIKNLQPITVTDKNVKRYFMTVEEAVSLIIQSSSLKGKNRTFVLDMGDQFKIYEIARKMIIMNGFSIRNKDNPDGDITIKITGLQKGEKMGEALFLENAQLIKTEHPKIFRINENFLSLDVENFFNFLDRNYDNNNDTFLDEWIHKGKKGIKI